MLFSSLTVLSLKAVSGITDLDTKYTIFQKGKCGSVAHTHTQKVEKPRSRSHK